MCEEYKKYLNINENLLIDINKFKLPKIYKQYNKILPILTSKKPILINKICNLTIDYNRNKLTNVPLHILLLILEYEFSRNYDTTIYQY